MSVLDAQDSVLLQHVVDDGLLLRLTQPAKSRTMNASGGGSGSMAPRVP